MDENAVDVIKLGIEYILLAIFIFIVVQVVQMRNSYAESLNNRQAQTETAAERLEFSLYDTGDLTPSQNTSSKYIGECLSGDEVIACIRKYSDGSINVYVDGMKGTDPYIHDDKTWFDNEKAEDIDRRYIFKEAWLKKHIYADQGYHPYIIYEKQPYRTLNSAGNVTAISTDWYFDPADHSDPNITGIAFIKAK